ncbi:MAG TPA: alanine racemase [Candidatus Blautia intestinipullorum]|nr:alanine racemase [Candidatus Blautia intestinipullorum]
MKRYDRVKAVVSLDAIARNFEEMRKNIAEDTKIMAVIKADGYGHGAQAIAMMIHDYPYIWGFAVATPEEAIELRNSGVTKPVLILGLVFEEYFPELISRDISLAVADFSMAEKLDQEAARQEKKVHIHLALDTGMSRIGFADNEESVEEIRKIAGLENVGIEGMFTHFARADEKDKSPAKVQLQRYLDFSELLEKAGIKIPLRHCSNSAGIIRMPEANLNVVRAGITIYGIYPSSQVERDIVKLTPAMELISHVTFVKDIPAGTAVSYGGTFVAEKPVRVATVPVGYADGYPRSLSGRGWVLIRGKRAPILGRVCMDQFMVDVTDIPEVKPGDKAVLIGKDGKEEISMEEFGDLSGRFSYEFACCIGKRVPRVYIKDGKEWGELTFFE